jgi:DMSO reductase anchor subunit
MRPTFSIIVFTVLSGAGYGLWTLLALILLGGQAAASIDGSASGAGAGWTISCLALGFVLVGIGLLSSLGHLGKPLRAWRAFSQWRSSWLSREGVSAVLTFVPVLAFAALHGTADPRWSGSFAATLCLLLILAGSLATMVCTANIYACLKPVRAWHNRYVVAGYLLLGLHGGILLAWVLARLHADPMPALALLPFGVTATALAGAILKIVYWRYVDGLVGPTTAHAIGLDGDVRAFEHPHTQENYLTHEMGFRLARKHARKLRRLALLGAFVAPALLAIVALLLPASATFAAWLALVGGIIGIFVERWLFFAEARHAVMLYYGAR